MRALGGRQQIEQQVKIAKAEEVEALIQLETICCRSGAIL
jgi:hypothetical protein